jgi:peptidoglycan/xylan/chitin deacetylase (PgdA/CDA1 family)
MLRVVSVAVALLALEYVAPSSTATRAAVLASLTAAAALMVFFVTSPRTQWVVPTQFVGPANGRGIALTFDDGPDPVFTPRLLDVLRAHGARATFFMVGERVLSHPDLVRRVRDEGHQIGSHSHQHRAGFHFLGPRRMVAEIQRGIDAIEQVTGVRAAAFRPPLGLRVPVLKRALARLSDRVTCVTWTQRALDTGARSAASIASRLEPHLVQGAILCLHDGAGFGGSLDRSSTVHAIELLLPRIAARGLRCVRLDELGVRADATTGSELARAAELTS